MELLAAVPEQGNDSVLDKEEGDQELSLKEFTGYFQECIDQPAWRSRADKEWDYKDGNQLDSNLLQQMRERGIPPAIDPLIGMTIESILGAEAKKRTDWRVTPDSDMDGQDVADALNYKLNQAEKRSRADRSCSDAYEAQVSVGLGWVEVSRNIDPFKYPYRCSNVHRNEIFWDWHAKDPMLQDARYLIRMKWMDKAMPKMMFPEHADLLEHVTNGWGMFDAFSLDGSSATGLAMSQDQERGWSIEEQQWRDRTLRRIRLFEVWYRRWIRALVLKAPDGRVIEFDNDNPLHMAAISRGLPVVSAIISKVRRSWWAGPHKLADEPSPFLHSHFPYVPFWGSREDRTGVPFGRIRAMMYMQDNVNASTAKIRWGLAATVTTRTKGAVYQEDEQFRAQVARPDADIILDHRHMAEPGATFRIDRNFELNEQQYKMLVDSRNNIQRLGGISNEFQGVQNNSTSGVQFNAQVEQSQQSLANIDDNFKEARSQVGELLLSMIAQDLREKENERVVIPGNGISPDKEVVLNAKIHDESGIEYLDNDVSRTLLKVVLEDIPSTPSYRTQQLAVMSEAYKVAEPEYRKVMTPHLFNLLDVPNKQEMLKELAEAAKNPTPEMQEMQRKMKELEIKSMLGEAQVEQIKAVAVKTLVESQYAALQGGSELVTIPGVAPVADKIMQNSGYVQPVAPVGQDPGLSDVQLQEAQQQVAQAQPVRENTSPALPPVPQSAGNGMQGIEAQGGT
jgi:hypothetical protein